METVQYNFNTIISALGVLKDNEDVSANKANIDAKNTVMAELNSFFSDFTCTEMIYTLNTDKPMFGLNIRPIGKAPENILDEMINNTDGTFIPYPKYQVELDSKLVEILSPAEICAILINDVNELCNARVVKAVRDMIDSIMAFSNDTVDLATVSDTLPLFRYVIEITLHNITSVLARSIDDVVISEFMIGYKLNGYLESAVAKIFGQDISGALAVFNPAMILNWYFMVYQDAKTNRYVSGVIRKSITLDGSILMARSAKMALEDISMVSDKESAYLTSITESVARKKKGLVSQMKRNGLKSLEEDLYEYGMRLRNVETQDDAILLMRQLNSRMSILEDYINYEDLDDSERARWSDVYKKYQEIRAELSKKTVYNRKMYGLFVDYNALAQMDKNSQNSVMQSYY